MRGATQDEQTAIAKGLVSIHAPRAGCDINNLTSDATDIKFQFTHPVRGATSALFDLSNYSQFQFTHPVRGATQATDLRLYPCWFQFTHPVRGATA